MSVETLFCAVLLPGFAQSFHLDFLSMRFVNVGVVQRVSNIETVTVSKKYIFILSERSDFSPIDNQSIAAYAFTRCMLTSPSVNKILLSRCENLTTNFRGLTLQVDIAQSRLKHDFCFICVRVKGKGSC